MNIRDKVFVVTGGASGMGRQLCLELANRGASVAVADLNPESLREMQHSIPENQNDRVTFHTLDVAGKDAVFKLPNEIIKKHGCVDGLINNAGIIQPFVRVNDLSLENIHRVFNVNFFGALYMTKAFLPFLLQRPEAHLVNICSMGGFVPVPGQTAYGASKAAVKLLSEGLMSELCETGIRVTVVFPGAVQTNIALNSGVAPPGSAQGGASKFNALPALEAAKQIIAGIEKNKKRLFVGSDSKLMNLLYRISPAFASDTIYKKMKSLLP